MTFARFLAWPHKGTTMRKPTTPMPDVPVIRCGSEEPRADSRDIAKRLRLQHESVYKNLKERKADFEQFGKLRFEIGASASGQTEKYAMLNEDQAYLLLAYSRNTAKPITRTFPSP